MDRPTLNEQLNSFRVPRVNDVGSDDAGSDGFGSDGAGPVGGADQHLVLDPAQLECRELQERLTDTPAIRDQFRRAQAWDSVIRQALVSSNTAEDKVPDGLLDRLLLQLPLEERPHRKSASTDRVELTPAKIHAASVDEPSGTSRLPPRFGWSKISRRRVSMALATLAAAVVLGIVSIPRQGRLHDLGRESVELIQSLPKDGWQQMEHAPLTEYPSPFDRIGLYPNRWQRDRTRMDSRTVFYDYGQIRGGALIVSVSSVGREVQLPSTVPETGNYVSGWNVYSWQQGQRVFVALTQMSPDDFRRLIQQPSPLVG